MSKINIAVFMLFVFIVFSAPVSAGGELKYFSSYKLSHRLNDKLDIFTQPDIRFNDDIGYFNYYHIRSGAVYHILKNLDCGLTYRYLRSRTRASNWKTENRIEIDTTPKINLGDFKLSDRSRFEYREFEAGKDKWRYRNSFKISTPFEAGDFKCTPYISNEIYIDLKDGVFNKDWATIGFTKALTEKITLDIYYRVENIRVRHGEWDMNSIIGTGLSFKI